MKSFNYSCQGESHIATNKPCQDASYSNSNDAMSIAIVCDGHGGEKYIRSDFGAQTAVEVIKECVTQFVNGAGELFIGKPFTQGIGSDVRNSAKLSGEANEKIDNAFKQLFGAIVLKWRLAIHNHYDQNPVENLDVQIEKLYGCTLMCFVITSDYYFGFHLGDGKCISFDVCPGYTVVWSEPIPWDDRCFLNKTTSICEENAADEFRYCYCGNSSINSQDETFKSPIAVFLGSDGIDDSFGPDENMINFYVSILKLIVKQGHNAIAKEIEETLPQLSKIGSKDDMSVACIYNEELIVKWFQELVRWQINKIKNSEIYEKERKRNDLIQKIEHYSNTGNHSQKDDIELNYAKQDIQKLDNEIEKLKSRVEKLQQELTDYETSRGCPDQY